MRARMKYLIRSLTLILIWLALFAGLLMVPAANAQESDSAMLAVVGADGNLSIYDAQGKNPFPLTVDGNPLTRSYQWPTWSTDGRLAFFGINLDPDNPYSLRVFVVEQAAPGMAAHVAFTGRVGDIFTYAYWSPGDCPDRDCRDLALLYTPREGSSLIALLLRDSGAQFREIPLGRASPFYYSFSPDGQKMLWHRYAVQLDLYDIANAQTTRLPDTPGSFQTPMWSPVDRRLLFATAGSDESKANIVIADGNGRTTLLPDQAIPVSFAWSPDGACIASVSGFTKVVVTDVQAGHTLATSAQSEVLAHFWSPQGGRVAYLSLTRTEPIQQTGFSTNGHNAETSLRAQHAPPTITWYVLDIRTGQSTALTSFVPTESMVYLVNFFDQFARSHRLWSPDGRYLVYGELGADGQAEVRLADTRNPGTTIKVADGQIGIWSWH